MTVIQLSNYTRSSFVSRSSYVNIQKIPIINKRKGGNFVDNLKVSFQAGNGGSGGCSFGPPTRTGHGKPTGGNGGRGGSIYLQTDPSLFDLKHVSRHLTASSGGRGGKEYSNGEQGKDITIYVPLGTIVHVLDYKDANIQAHDQFKDDFNDNFIGNAIIDMNEHPMTIHVVQGGNGGRGNTDFGKQNREYELGWNGARALIQFDLKTIADAGLVGFPNAGKSSFLAAISNANPEIASYPFTTLKPSLGKIKSTLISHLEENKKEIARKFTIADIPGLVEGAHMNIGLGHSFLKHIVRCSLIIYMIDITIPHPLEMFKTLKRELRMFNHSILDRPSIVLANKCDLVTPFNMNWNSFRDHIFEIERIPVFPISAKNGSGIQQVINTILEMRNRLQ